VLKPCFETVAKAGLKQCFQNSVKTVFCAKLLSNQC